MKSCFFIGHADAPDAILPKLRVAIMRHIEVYGVTEFYIGHYGNFDRMAVSALREAKEKHPEITLMLLLPYHPAERPMEAPSGFDGTYYPFETPESRRYSIVKANRQMINACGYLIAYANHLGKSRDFLDYARRREEKGLIHVENIDLHL